MKISFRKAIKEVKNLPNGGELTKQQRYSLILHAIEMRDKTWPWQISRKKFWNAMLQKLVKPCPQS